MESTTINPVAWKGSVNPRVIPYSLIIGTYCIGVVQPSMELSFMTHLGKNYVCLIPIMGITLENVAHCFVVSRKEQDEAVVSWK